MLIVSQVIDLVAAAGGPRLSHKLYLRRLARWRTFEPEYHLLHLLVDPRRAAVDVGANEGIYAGRLSELCRRVHCFEPIPWFAEKLRTKLDPDVLVHPFALSDHAGEAELRIPHISGTEMHGTSTLEPQNLLGGASEVRRVTCRLERLDAVVNDEVGFIKIDVEGHELAVLKGATRILRDSKPVLLVEAEQRHHPEAPENVFRYLADLGYVGLFLEDHRLRNLAAFDPGRHQRPENVQRQGALYVNNFIFLPGTPSADPAKP